MARSKRKDQKRKGPPQKPPSPNTLRRRQIPSPEISTIPIPEYDISFEDVITSIRETGILPKPHRGADGHYTIRRYPVNHPAFIPTFDPEQVKREFAAGADVVICVNDREISWLPSRHFTYDRPALHCGCHPDSGCSCMMIMMGHAPPDGYTNDTSAHEAMTSCTSVQPPPSHDQDLHALALSSHDWSNGRDFPDFALVAESPADRLHRETEVCTRCQKVKATSYVLPISYGSRQIAMDTTIFNLDTEISAAWLHHRSTDTMLPCSDGQYDFAHANIQARIDNYDFF